MTDEPKSIELEPPADDPEGDASTGQGAQAEPLGMPRAGTLDGVAPPGGLIQPDASGALSAGPRVVVAGGRPTRNEDDDALELPGVIGPDTHRRMQEAGDSKARESFLKALAEQRSTLVVSDEPRGRSLNWLLVIGCVLGLLLPFLLWLGARRAPEEAPDPQAPHSVTGRVPEAQRAPASQPERSPSEPEPAPGSAAFSDLSPASATMEGPQTHGESNSASRPEAEKAPSTPRPRSKPERDPRASNPTTTGSGSGMRLLPPLP